MGSEKEKPKRGEPEAKGGPQMVRETRYKPRVLGDNWVALFIHLLFPFWGWILGLYIC